MTLFISILDEVGGALLFLQKILRSLFYKKIKIHEVFEQIWKVTADSFFTTAMAGFFVGAIMTVQFALQMKEFGALGYLGGLATSGTFREVGPLLIAFMLSGKVGAFTSAELGTMRVTEQIDAVRCLGADPMQEIIAPRFLGIIISSFFLLGGGLIMSVFGGMLMGYAFAGVNFEEYLRHVPMIVSPVSILSGVIKCGAFALVLATICTFKGFTTTGGAKGVGRAVVATSVSTMICIVVVDWMTSFLGEVILQMIRGYRS
ncbi:organic solvent ABC transporter permease [Bdellovibrio bacteriovorus]|uniref:Organic solvent ABC transporter permease n=1 Tax=Bdellovibrio bacteriovorus TaxID=959 RepID=A0A161PER5_BDEBC|nr:ABC transporter permease [Bdellovibrio bacteriovorus]KYG68884.1 organic solvent ABC transporter permease [Bdellovibrio bacteriovorus]